MHKNLYVNIMINKNSNQRLCCLRFIFGLLFFPGLLATFLLLDGLLFTEEMNWFMSAEEEDDFFLVLSFYHQIQTWNPTGEKLIAVVCTCVCACVCVRACVPACVCAYVCVCACVCMCVGTYVCLYICMLVNLSCGYTSMSLYIHALIDMGRIS